MRRSRSSRFRRRMASLTSRASRSPVALLALVALLAGCRESPTAPAPLPVPALTIVTETLPPGMRGTAYAEGIHGDGGDLAYRWDVVAGELPRGLMLMVDDLGVDHAMVTGVPEEPGTFTFTVRLRSGDGQSVTRQLTLVVHPEPTPVALHHRRVPPALVGAPYRVRLRANGGDGQSYTWTVLAGRLPTGLTLTSAGRFEGSPAVVETTSFTVRVQSGEEAMLHEYALRVVPNDVSAFRITLFEVEELPPGVRPHLAAALARIEAAVVGNLAAVTIPETFFQPGQCGGFGPQINGTSVDDLMIILSMAAIDGPGRVLGQAGPCALRPGNRLPLAGIVVLDADDVVPLIGTETLTDIIVHEIAHVLGFGTLWELLGLIAGAGTQDPRFTGARAVAEYQRLGGSGTVELENQGGEGTAEGHWRKTRFHIELMTGFVERVGIAQPMSRVTIESWGDLGYAVNPAAAEPFALVGAGAAALAPRDEALWREFLGHDHVYRGPVVVLGEDGRATEVELR
jgi:hypothetical protein